MTSTTINTADRNAEEARLARKVRLWETVGFTAAALVTGFAAGGAFACGWSWWVGLCLVASATWNACQAIDAFYGDDE